MEFILESSLKLLSVNQAFATTRTGVRIKSQAYKNFQHAIHKIIWARRIEFNSFNNFFDPKIHEVHAELIYYTPELFTKKGMISKTSGDVANFEKCITDCVLTGRIDDSSIVQWLMIKKIRDSKGFRVSYRIVARATSSHRS